MSSAITQSFKGHGDSVNNRPGSKVGVVLFDPLTVFIRLTRYPDSAENTAKAEKARCGPKFHYDKFLVLPSRWMAVGFLLGLASLYFHPVCATRLIYIIPAEADVYLP